ncbi:MAG: hypothetical protein II134_02460 [Lachnospiraceae bacterium]|nr:hypothetical protein [Lachnospiraceae bacterium]
MEVLKQHWLGLLLCLVAVAIFSSALQFRKYRIMMAGESISPKWFSLVKWGGMIGAIVLFLTQVSHFGSWFSTDFMQTVTFKSDRDAVLGTVVYVVLLLIASLVVGAIVHKVPERWWKADSAKVFDEDKVCQFLLKDAEAGAKEILIFRDRLEGRRGYSFDVDGYNHAAFSADGCKMLAKYIDSRVPGAYTVEECHEAQGKGGAPQSSSSGALSDNSYRFSHMRLVKKN